MGEENSTIVEEKKPKKRRLINTNLVMLKLTLFFLYGANSSLVPYLTVHMRSIGIRIEDIALIYLALPFTTFLAPPVTGFLVDKFGRYKAVVIISFILNAAIHHSLFLFPHQEFPGVVPPGYIMRHPRSGNVEVWWSPCPSRECPEDEELDIILDMCSDHCLLKRDVKVYWKQNKSVKVELKIDMGEEDDISLHLGKAKKNITKSSSRKGGNRKKLTDNDTALFFVLDMHPDLGEAVEQLGIEMEQDANDTVTDFKQNFSEKLLRKAGVNLTELEENDLRCGGIVLRANGTDQKRLAELYGNCMVQKCNFRSGGPKVCPPDYKDSGNTTFWLYFLLRFVGTIMMTAGVTIMDPIAFTMIEKYGGDFGREKLFSSLGMALFSPFTGALIDFASRKLEYTDYSAAFYTYDALLIISALTVFFMPLGTKLPADNMFRDLINIFKMPNIIIFIIFLFLLGNVWGFIESFLFFYLQDLGAPNYLLGITVTVGTVSSMPFLYGAEKITKKIGHINVIVIAFFAHAGRLMGYSFIESAWWCFPFEALESLSVHLMWVAAATYCAVVAPKNLLATLIGVLGMAHFNVGRGSGSFLGGHLIGKVGIREAFRLMGCAAMIAGTLYGLLYYFWLKKMEHKEEDDTAGNENYEIRQFSSTVLPTEKVEATVALQDSGEPKYKDQSTMVSFERLSLMIECNQIGSLTSLGRGVKSDNHHTSITRARSNSIRRGSYSIGMLKTPRNSASKVDLLKSTLEVNHSRNSIYSKNSSGTFINHYSNSSKLLSDTTVSSPKIVRKSNSLTPVMDNELNKSLIPDETEEIIYDTTKKQVEFSDK